MICTPKITNLSGLAKLGWSFFYNLIETHFLKQYPIFTIYEVVNLNRLKAYNEDLQTIAAQHQMTREIVKELDSKLFITLDGYDELVKQQGFASTWRKFKAAQEQTKQE